MNAVNYQTDIFEAIVKRLNNTQFVGGHWIFRQDSAPTYKAKTTEQWLENNFSVFFAAEYWPSGSPGLKPLDYCLWNIVEEQSCCMPHHNIETFKADLMKSVASVPLDVVRAAIDECPGYLRKCVKANSGHFE